MSSEPWATSRTDADVYWRPAVLFTTPIFPLFFGLVYLVYRAMGQRWRVQNAWLLLASYAFYAWWDWRLCGLILLSTGVDYACALSLKGHRDPMQRKGKELVAVSVAVNLGVLALFKYAKWFTTELNAGLEGLGMSAELPILQLVAPVALSFYTFQSMAYTIDVYRGKTPAQRDPLTFALFVSFFPQLVAGPIERSERLMPQLTGPRRPTKLQLAEGLHLIVWGVFKKLFVADNLAVLVERVVDGQAIPNTGAAVWVATYAFAWQIYCDFSGYTDIARGVAKLLGIELSVNFKAPYLAHRPQDIWRRWHVSLSEWLRDYLYIPLGGNRRGRLRTQFNLLATMVLGGLWHGANWTYLLWGGVHGAALALDRARGHRPARWPLRLLGVVLTFHLSALAFLIFRAPSIERAWTLMQVQFTNIYMSAEDRMAFAQLGLLIAIPLAMDLLQGWRGRRGAPDHQLVLRWHPALQGLFTAALVLITLFLGATAGQSFIYYQF